MFALFATLSFPQHVLIQLPRAAVAGLAGLLLPELLERIAWKN